MAEKNYRRKVVDYFKKNLSKGYTSDSLKIALFNQGYSKSVIERAFEIANQESAENAPVIKEKPVIKYEIIDENNRAIKIKKSFWKSVFGK